MVTLDQCGWLGPSAVLVPPPPELADFVEHSFVLDMSLAPTRAWMIVPDPSAHFLVQRVGTGSGPGATRTSLVGARRMGVEIDVGGRAWTAGVRLKPGALPPVAGLPAHELTDRGSELGSVWGADGDRLESRLRSAVSPGEVQGLLLEFLGRITRTAPERHWMARACDQLATGRPDSSVEDVAQAMGASPRTLRARSQRDIGLAPKRLLRIRRLYRSISELRTHTGASLPRVARRSGFSDQSHLTREFRDLLGETPGQFHRRGRHADSYKPRTRRGPTLPLD